MIKEIVREIAAQSERASDIIELVRGYGKKKKRAFGVFNLTPVLQSVSEILRKGSCHIQIKTLLPPQLLVEADPLETELVFLNLMKNARDAVSQVSKPQIQLWAKEDSGDVLIYIEDNGPRISDEAFETMIHFGQTSKKEGTGFGLPIARQLLEAHGGALKIERKSDSGLICVVKLPLSKKQHCEDADACE
jgi:two-component system sensor histidine kinase TtrS